MPSRVSSQIFCHDSAIMAISLAHILLAIIIAVFLHLYNQQPYSPAPESPQASLPCAGCSGKKKRKARGKQKCLDGGNKVVAVQKEKGAKKLPFPLFWLSGAMKRRITEQYYEGLRRARNVDVDQVREFINCLVDVRNELLQKSENARRSFTIKKAMLSNTRNRRSSYDHFRLCEQVDKLESEHERLKKDAAVYNYLQEQLQLSAPYKLMMELNDVLEKEAREHALAAEEQEMSFEELLAQEKEDAAFWWRDGKLRSISGSK